MHTNCSRRSELLGGLRCPAVIVNQKWKGQSKIVGRRQDGPRSELDGQLTLISAHFPHKGSKLGEIRGYLDGNPGIRERETQTTRDLGRRLQYKPLRYDRLFPCGRVDPETENVGKHKRLTCERELYTRW